MFAAIAGIGGSVLGNYINKYQNDMITEYNEKLMAMQADNEERVAKAEVKRGHKRGRRMKASQAALYAKSGAMIDDGTPLTVMMEQAGEIEMDILGRYKDRINRARLMRTKGANIGMLGSIRNTASYASMGSDIMKAAGSAYDSWKTGGGNNKSTTSYGGDFAGV